MERLYIVTGASGHLGRNICRQLAEAGQCVRALALPGEELPAELAAEVEVLRGDVRRKETLRALFAGLEGRAVVAIHAAGIVDITSDVKPLAREVNVGGTANMIDLCLEYGVWRYIHVSSVHAIPEPAVRRVIREATSFAAGMVHGGYAKTKAEATQMVLDAARDRGLPAIVLHPSGIIGPLDSGNNNLVAAVAAFATGGMPACPRGGYDLVDVRDVAAACIAAADKGRVGETYILSGAHYEMRDVVKMLSQITGKKLRCPTVPMWMAKAAAPVLERRALRKGKAPLVTRYSMSTLTSNDNFSHEKASRELGFWPRDIYETLEDTVRWLEQQGRLEPKRRLRRRRRARAV